jgi:hypothetical protein
MKKEEILAIVGRGYYSKDVLSMKFEETSSNG